MTKLTYKNKKPVSNLKNLQKVITEFELTYLLSTKLTARESKQIESQLNILVKSIQANSKIKV